MAQGSAARKLPLQEPIQEDEIQYQPVNDPLYYRIIKRFLDLLLSVVALIILSPIFLVTAIAIVVDDSKGGPIFTQTRIGYLGKPFKFYKFRSMCVDAEEKLEDLRTKNEMTGPVFKIRDDKRVTRVGKFIRKYSIDELPQLVNIIKGEMSIVGPRPPLPNEVERYSDFERRRLSVVPGLICYWQVSGRNSVSFDRWMKLDMMYVEHHSLSVDIGLFLKGILTVVQGGGVKYERISFTSIDDNGLVYETERFLYLVCKRVMDIICSMVALGALSPVMGITSAAIKIEDRKGKVIYKQQRVGKHGKLFVFYKFRSMYEDADKLQEELQRMSDPNSPFYKIKDDPRITRIGRIIRKYSIDEIPQFWNVLKGDMSLVGPRPLQHGEASEYPDYLAVRQMVKPGLTSYWAVEERSSGKAYSRMENDMRYVRNQSLGVDISLIVRTIPAVFSGKGAA